MSDVPEGYHREWVDEPITAWQVAPDSGRTCRMTACQNPAVAMFWRRRRNSPSGGSWWHYCGDHLYGRRIKDGRVQSLRLVPDDESA